MTTTAPAIIVDRTTTWHAIGKSVQECKDPESVLAASGLDYEVVKEPVFAWPNEDQGGTPITIPNRFITMRENDQHMYDVVSDKFEIVQNRDAFDFVNYMGKHTAEATRGVQPPRFAMKLADVDYRAIFSAFWLKYGIVTSIFIFLALWTALTCTIVGLSVKKHTTAEVTDRLTRKYEQDLQDYKDTIAAERQAEYEASAEAARKTTIESAATEMAKAFEGIKGITENPDSLRTYGWNMAFRVSSREYPNTFEEVISQKNQYMGYSPGNPVIEKKYQIALEVVTAYYSGTWPVSNDFIYAEWDNTGKIILRDDYLAGRSTNYWWYGK